MGDFLETIATRASVRAFAPDRLSLSQWDAILKAAMAAPSAVNCQPWEFLVVEDRSDLETLARELPYAKMAATAGGALVVCAVPGRAFGAKLEFAVIDASLACGNALLAAHALGLGAVWTALYPEAKREACARRVLGIPEDVVPLALVPIGVPAESPKPKDKYDPARIHRGRW
jgi:nitroreductase